MRDATKEKILMIVMTEANARNASGKTVWALAKKYFAKDLSLGKYQ